MNPGIKHTIFKCSIGDVIFREGDPRRSLFVIKTGRVAIFKHVMHGDRVPLGMLGPGEYLGETGLVEGKQHHGKWAVAVSEVELISLPLDAINEQLKGVPPWLLALCKGLGQKIRAMNDMMRRHGWKDETMQEHLFAVDAAIEAARRVEAEKSKKAGN